MEQLIPDVESEMDAIAIRLLVIKMEHPTYHMDGMLASLKSHINRMCFLSEKSRGELYHD